MVRRDQNNIVISEGKTALPITPRTPLPTVKVVGDSIMVLGCFSSKGTVNIRSMEEIVNSSIYKGISKENLIVSVKLGPVKG